MCDALRFEATDNHVFWFGDGAAMGGVPFQDCITTLGERNSGGATLAVLFYGDLYNLQELVKEVGCDERNVPGILLDLYSDHGMKFVDKLRGEFALALWDGREDAVFLITDRFRVCPLFYYVDAEKLIFSSRLSGILACSLVKNREIDPEAIVDVIGNSVIPSPKTIFKEVKKIPPGHFLKYQKGKVCLEQYWDIVFSSSNKMPASELARNTRQFLQESIEIRLAGEKDKKRIGAFLSGGVDSSTVVGILSRLMGFPVKTFSIGFNEKRFNEIDYARIASHAFGTEHHEYFVSPKDVRDVIPLLLKSFDEPYANASAIPVYYCAKMARENQVDVLYAGDGGDELFAGNERYATQRLFEYYGKIPPLLREYLIRPTVFKMAETSRSEFWIKAKKYIIRASIPYPARLTSYGFLKTVPMGEIFEDHFLDVVGRDYDPYSIVDHYYFQAPAHTELDRQLYIDLKLAIADNDLFKVTRMTEMAGVRVRFPFLDHRLVEFSASIPAGIKMRGRRLRSFFKKTYSDLLPPQVITKTKHGFGLPIPVWLKTDPALKEMLHDLILSPRSLQRGYFRKKTLIKILEAHQNDETSFYGTVLWNLMVLELWHRAYIDEPLSF